MSSVESPGEKDCGLSKRQVGESVFEVPVQEAVEQFLEDKSREIRLSTVQSYRSSLSFFITWCKERKHEFMPDIGGRELQNFRQWRRTDGNEADGTLSGKTLKGDMKTLRQFIRWCEQTDYVRQGTAEKVRVPAAQKNTERNRQGELCSQSAAKALEYAKKHHYASNRHVTLMLLAETGARPSGIRALDLCHYERHTHDGVLKFRDDPTTGGLFKNNKENGVRLKNGQGGERDVTISKACCDVLDDYIEHNRNKVIDEYERKPLITPGTGRIGLSTIRKYCYELTRPCITEGFCPSGLSQEECKGYTGRAHHCKDNVSPKALRKGHVSHLARENVDMGTVSERCDASESVIEKHYNQMDEGEKRRARVEDLKHVSWYAHE